MNNYPPLLDSPLSEQRSRSSKMRKPYFWIFELSMSIYYIIALVAIIIHQIPNFSEGEFGYFLLLVLWGLVQGLGIYGLFVLPSLGYSANFMINWYRASLISDQTADSEAIKTFDAHFFNKERTVSPFQFMLGTSCILFLGGIIILYGGFYKNTLGYFASFYSIVFTIINWVYGFIVKYKIKKQLAYLAE